MAKARKPASGSETPAAKASTSEGSDKAASSDAKAQETTSAKPGKETPPAASTDAPKTADAKAESASAKAAEAKTDKSISSAPVTSDLPAGPSAPKPSAASRAGAAGAAKETGASTPEKPSEPEKPSSSATSKSPAATQSAAKPADAKSPADSKSADAAGAKSAQADAPKSSVTPTSSSSPKPDATPAYTKSAASDTAAASAEPQPRRSVFWPLVLGGVIAGTLGFVASEMNVLNTRVDTDALRQDLAQQRSDIEALRTAEAPASPGAPDLSGIEEAIAGISQTVGAIESRLAELENRPVATAEPTTPQPDYRDELAALQASVEEQQSEIERLLDSAMSVEEATQNAVRQAAVQRALTGITAALNSGSGYDAEIGDLENNGVSDVPAGLTAPAAEGVPTLLELQTDYPDAAREALAAARASGADGEGTGVAGFLRRQLSARSVAPREGSAPDAILSRAEAAVREGRLADALADLDGLPPQSKTAMDSWLRRAQARVDAETAVQDLSQRLTAN